MTGLTPWVDSGKAYRWLEKRGLVEPATPKHMDAKPYKVTFQGKNALRDLKALEIPNFILKCPINDRDAFSMEFQELLTFEEDFPYKYPDREDKFFLRFPKMRQWKDAKIAEYMVMDCGVPSASVCVLRSPSGGI